MCKKGGEREGERREEKNDDGDVVYLSFKHKCSSLFVQPSDFSLTVIFTGTGLRVRCMYVRVCVYVCVCVRERERKRISN